MLTRLSILALCCLGLAGMPQPKTLRVSWAPYTVPPFCSNGVVVIYKSTSLGSVFTPYKPTAFVPASRTNQVITVLGGQLYHFVVTGITQPLPESPPSNVSTNQVP